MVPLDLTASISATLGAALADFERLRFPAGGLVFSEGDPGDRAFMVEEGSVTITKETDQDTPLVLGTIDRGHMFGEMALIDGQPRMANAVAAADTVLISLPRSLFLDEIARTTPFTKLILKTLMVHLRNMGIRMVSQAGLAKVPFVERFLHAFIAHSRGLLDISHFFCDADGVNAQEAVRVISDDPVCKIWCSISAKLCFSDDADLLDREEMALFLETFGKDSIANNEGQLSDLIYSGLADKASLVAVAWKVFQKNFS